MYVSYICKPIHIQGRQNESGHAMSICISVSRHQELEMRNTTVCTRTFEIHRHTSDNRNNNDDDMKMPCGYKCACITPIALAIVVPTH